MSITFVSVNKLKPISTFAPRGFLFSKLRHDMTFRDRYQYNEIVEERKFNQAIQATFTKKFKFGDLISNIPIKPAPAAAVSNKIELIQNKRFLTALDIWWSDNEPHSSNLRIKEFRATEVGGFRGKVGYAMPQELESEPLIKERDLQNYPDERSWFYLKHNEMPTRIKRKWYPYLFKYEHSIDVEHAGRLGIIRVGSEIPEGSRTLLGPPLRYGKSSKYSKPYNTYNRRKPGINPMHYFYHSYSVDRTGGGWNPIGLGLNLWAKLYPSYPLSMLTPEYVYDLIGYEVIVGHEEKFVRLVNKRRKLAARKFLSKISRVKPVRFFNFSGTKEVRVLRTTAGKFNPLRVTTSRLKTLREIEAPLFGSDPWRIFDLEVQLGFARIDWKEQNLERLEHDELLRYPKSTRDPSNRDPIYGRRYKQLVFNEPILWEDNASYVSNSEIDEGSDEFSSVKTIATSDYFPRSRDKGHHKRNHMLSSFSKLWQREHSVRFFKQLSVHFNFLKTKIKNLSLGKRLRSIQNVKQTTSILYHKKFDYLFQFSLLGLLNRTLCCDLQVVLAFIKDGLVYVNGKQITDPLFIVSRLSLIKLGIPIFIFPIFDLLVWKLTHFKGETVDYKESFSKFGPPSTTEVSFKLGEMLLLADQLSIKGFRRQMFNLEFSPGLLHGQRFFTKQKKFGMGRLL